MAVKITGLNLLNANIYDEMTIVERDGNYIIAIHSSNKAIQNLYIQSLEPPIKIGTINKNLSNNFNENKVLGDNEILINTVQKFLEYATINNLTSKSVFYKSKFQIAGGTRFLKFNLSNQRLNGISQMIVNKYLEDRLKFCAKNENMKKIMIDLGNCTSYEVNADYLKLTLMKDSPNIAFYEKQFFEEFISDKLNIIGDYASLEYVHTIFKTRGSQTMMEYMNLICGDLKIDIAANAELLEIVKKVVNDHNKELNENKIIQLKMEGF